MYHQGLAVFLLAFRRWLMLRFFHYENKALIDKNDGENRGNFYKKLKKKEDINTKNTTNKKHSKDSHAVTGEGASGCHAGRRSLCSRAKAWRRCLRFLLDNVAGFASLRFGKARSVRRGDTKTARSLAR